MTYETEIRQYYRKIGKCPYCHGRNKLMGDEKMCPECRAAKWISKQSYIARHPEYRTKNNESAQALRDFRKANQMCISCGENLPDSKYTRCQRCRVRNMLTMRRYRERHGC